MPKFSGDGKDDWQALFSSSCALPSDIIGLTPRRQTV
jgi:hypothetical protein